MNEEQRDTIADGIYGVLVANTPPLTENERNGINADIGRVLDNYTTDDEGGPPTAVPVIKLPWPTPTKATNETYDLKGPTTFEYMVPQAEPARYGAFQVTATPDSGSAPSYRSVLSETPGGPPMAGEQTSLEGTSPRTAFTVTKPQPGGYVYAVLQPGSTYYQTVTPLTTGAWRTNIQLLAMGTF